VCDSIKMIEMILLKIRLIHNSYVILDQYCPIFRLNEILLLAEPSKYERYQMLLKVKLI